MEPLGDCICQAYPPSLEVIDDRVVGSSTRVKVSRNFTQMVLMLRF